MQHAASGGSLRAWLNRISIAVLMTVVVPSCSLRRRRQHRGHRSPAERALMAQKFFDTINGFRRDLTLSPVARDAALDALAKKGLQAIEAGIPEGVKVLDHVKAEAALPPDMS